MVRICKDPIERKTEIINIAEELFRTQGFEQTTVSDIVKKIGVAQGLFYYYFKSKEEVLEAVAERLADLLLTKVETVVAEKALNPLVKLQRILVDIINIEEVMSPIHQVSLESLHQKISIKIMDKLIPLCVQVVQEGKQQGIFKIEAPEVAVEILFVGLERYVNKTYREALGKSEFEARIQMAVRVLETTLAVPCNSLQFKTDWCEESDE